MERRTSTPIRLFSPLFRRVTLTPASILLPTLFVTSLISLSILSFLLGLFLLHRLYLNLQSSTTTDKGRQADYENLSRGVKAWIDETADRVPPVPFDMSSLRLGPIGPVRRARFADDRAASTGNAGTQQGGLAVEPGQVVVVKEEFDVTVKIEDPDGAR
jgi:hypothetical protein